MNPFETVLCLFMLKIYLIYKHFVFLLLINEVNILKRLINCKVQIFIKKLWIPKVYIIFFTYYCISKYLSTCFCIILYFNNNESHEGINTSWRKKYCWDKKIRLVISGFLFIKAFMGNDCDFFHLIIIQCLQRVKKILITMQFWHFSDLIQLKCKVPCKMVVFSVFLQLCWIKISHFDHHVDWGLSVYSIDIAIRKITVSFFFKMQLVCLFC